MDKKQQLIHYISNHPELFDDYDKKFLIQYINSEKDDEFLPDLIRELYDRFGMIEDENNIYVAFINLIRRFFDIEDAHIIEVGGGTFPCIGRRISLLQNRGTITVYDPKLCMDEKENDHLTLKRETFTRDTFVGDTNLMIGFMPCKGAEALVDSATDHGIDFMVALCEGGPHGDYFDYFESEDEWIDSMFYRARRGIEEHGMGRLARTYLKKFQDPYPIIFNKRK